MVRLGVGKNMVRSMRHWGIATGVLEELQLGGRTKAIRVSALGELLFAEKQGLDPYLEDPATLWLLHWQLASTPGRSTTWFWVFNQCPQLEFTKEELLRWLTSLIEQRGGSRLSEASLRRDIDTFLRTYAATKPSKSLPMEETLDCPLVELELIREFGRGAYVLVRGEQSSLPDELFAYAVIDCIGRLPRAGSTVALDDVAFAPGAPGRVFCLSEESLLARLERMGALTDGAVLFDDTAGMKQLLLKRDVPDAVALLRRYYAGRG